MNSQNAYDIEKFKRGYSTHKNSDEEWREECGGISYRQAQRWGSKFGLKKDPSLLAHSKEGGEKVKAEIVSVEELGKMFVEKMKEKPVLRLPAKRELFVGKLEESAVLLLGDIHAGKKNFWLNSDTNRSEETYNLSIMRLEFDRLVDSMAGINILLSHSYNIRKLYIFGLGDWVENNMIFHGQQWYVEKGVGGQAIILTQIMKDFLLICLKMYDEVELITVSGNHGRMTEGRESAPIENSFDWMVSKNLEMLFEGHDRIKINTSESWEYYPKIYDWKFRMSHGEDVKSWMGFPYYGVNKKTTKRRNEVDFDVECIGHWHRKFEIPISSKAVTLINGAWIPKDDFGWKIYGEYSAPVQWYFGVSPKRPRTWSFGLDLLHDPKEWRR